jgi:chromosome segregation ATPase
MEMRFEREQAHARASRLENRLLELELLATAPSASGGPTPASYPAPASKQVKSLEQVIEGLERVIAQQKAELKRQKDDLDGKHDDRRHKAEVARLRKKVESLEEQLGAQDQQQRRGRATAAHKTDEFNHARKAQEMAEVELQRKEAQITALEQQIRNLSAARAGGRVDATGSDDSGDVARLGLELQELKMAREADAAALDEAQRALHEAELTEKRYMEVARENKRLRAEMGALEDEGFWREIEALQARADQGNKLLQESREALCSVFGAFPSLEPPSELLLRIDHHMATVAPAA